MTTRKGFSTVTPYLTTPDLDGLLHFLRSAVGAVETHREPGGSGGVHVEVRIGDSMLMVGGKAGLPTTAMLYLYVDDPDTHYRRSLDAGATSLMAPADVPDGERRSAVRDAWGNAWFFGKPLGTADDEEPRCSAVRPQPLIAVKDVAASSRWYRELLAARNLGGGSDHDHIYDRIYCGQDLVLQLHAWDHEDHPNLTNRALAKPGHGVLIWFEVHDFDRVVERARQLAAEIVLQPHYNPAPGHREMWLKDPDGYVIGIASRDGEGRP